MDFQVGSYAASFDIGQCMPSTHTCQAPSSGQRRCRGGSCTLPPQPLRCGSPRGAPLRWRARCPPYLSLRPPLRLCVFARVTRRGLIHQTRISCAQRCFSGTMNRAPTGGPATARLRQDARRTRHPRAGGDCRVSLAMTTSFAHGIEGAGRQSFRSVSRAPRASTVKIRG